MTARHDVMGWTPVLVGIALSIGVTWFVAVPAYWWLGIWFCVSVARVLGSDSSVRKILWFNAAVLLLVLSGVVLYMSEAPKAEKTPDNPEFRDVRHDFLGYMPNPGQQARFKRVRGGKLIYDVVYTVDGNGLRVSPPQEENRENECILFFGGSDVFGQGLNDEETLPYRVGIEMGSRYQVYNFGYKGYGPHHMLAALELGWVDSIIDCEPRYVIYQGGEGHIPRAVGLSAWDDYGPYFELTPQGEAEYKGQFDDPDRPIGSFSRFLAVSGLQTTIPGLHRASDGDDYDLFLAILHNARRHVMKNYPGAEFHVLFWDEPRRGGLFPLYLFDWSRPPLLEGLEQSDLEVHRMTEILPDLAHHPGQYKITGDSHPNAMAQAMTAKYLARELSQMSGVDR